MLTLVPKDYKDTPRGSALKITLKEAKQCELFSWMQDEEVPLNFPRSSVELLVRALKSQQGDLGLGQTIELLFILHYVGSPLFGPTMQAFCKMPKSDVGPFAYASECDLRDRLWWLPLFRKHLGDDAASQAMTGVDNRDFFESKIPKIDLIGFKGTRNSLVQDLMDDTMLQRADIMELVGERDLNKPFSADFERRAITFGTADFVCRHLSGEWSEYRIQTLLSHEGYSRNRVEIYHRCFFLMKNMDLRTQVARSYKWPGPADELVAEIAAQVIDSSERTLVVKFALWSRWRIFYDMALSARQNPRKLEYLVVGELLANQDLCCMFEAIMRGFKAPPILKQAADLWKDDDMDAKSPQCDLKALFKQFNDAPIQYGRKRVPEGVACIVSMTKTEEYGPSYSKGILRYIKHVKRTNVPGENFRLARELALSQGRADVVDAMEDYLKLK